MRVEKRMSRAKRDRRASGSCAQGFRGDDNIGNDGLVGRAVYEKEETDEEKRPPSWAAVSQRSSGRERIMVLKQAEAMRCEVKFDLEPKM